MTSSTNEPGSPPPADTHGTLREDQATYRTRVIAMIRRPDRRLVVAAATAVALALALLAAWYFLFRDNSENASTEACGGQIAYWHDPMVPAERYPGPGKSSMNMDLIPKCANDAGGGVRVSPEMMQSLGVRVVRAEVRDLAPTIPAVGRVVLDERLIAEVQTLTPGFVETLAIRAEGEPVRQGQVVATVYSPELLGAQYEYAALRKIRGSAVTPSLREASRNRLRLLGLPAGIIQRLDRGGAPQRTYPIFASRSGVVTTIGARPGAQVTPGQSILTISGLSRVLVMAEIPETALGNVRVGLPVEISFAAFPGETRQGAIDYIYPTLNAEARTGQVRITLENPGQRLRQGMFANITVQGAGGMALVVPSEAVIDTGRRKIVIVRRNGAFLPAEVQTGREAGEWSEILAGVQPGEEVVASGQFLIDSEASISGVMARLNRGVQGSAPPQPAPASGTVQSLNPEQGQVTISHGPIPALNWPAMSMTFVLRDRGALRSLKRGDQVNFTVNPNAQGGSYVIERIEKAPAQ